MRSGLLRHQISILSPGSSTRTTDGAPVIALSTIHTAWADVQTVTARENFRNDMRWAETDKIFKIRYTTVAIAAKDKILFNGDTYEIQGTPINVGERKRELEMVGRKIV